jgi:hypothetical protein
MALDADPNERFLQREHPEIIAARSKPHAFVPYPIAPGHDVCTSRCVCDACWEPKGNRKAHPRGVPA